jgi:hypothetical protein
VYRLVQDALTAAISDRPVAARISSGADELRVDLQLELDDDSPLTAARAWVSVLHGSLVVERSRGGAQLLARLPMRHEPVPLSTAA